VLNPNLNQNDVDDKLRSLDSKF